MRHVLLLSFVFVSHIPFCAPNSCAFQTFAASAFCCLACPRLSSPSFVSSRAFGNGSKIQLAIFVALLLNVDSPRPILAWLRHFYLIPAQAPFCPPSAAAAVVVAFNFLMC